MLDLYYAFMCWGYTTTYVLGIMSITDSRAGIDAARLLRILYVTDIFACVGGFGTKQAWIIHLPALVMLTRIIGHDRELIPPVELSLLNLMVTSISIASGNQAMSIARRVMPRDVLEMPLCRNLHALTTTLTIGQLIAALAYASIRLIYMSSEFQVEYAMAAMYVRYVQIPLLVKAIRYI